MREQAPLQDRFGERDVIRRPGIDLGDDGEVLFAKVESARQAKFSRDERDGIVRRDNLCQQRRGEGFAATARITAITLLLLWWGLMAVARLLFSGRQLSALQQARDRAMIGGVQPCE